MGLCRSEYEFGPAKDTAVMGLKPELTKEAAQEDTST